MERNVGKLKKAERELTDAKEGQKTLEWERDQKSGANRVLAVIISAKFVLMHVHVIWLYILYHLFNSIKGECDKLRSTKKDLETKLSEMTACKETAEEQRDKQAKKCLDLEVYSSFVIP